MVCYYNYFDTLQIIDSYFEKNQFEIKHVVNDCKAKAIITSCDKVQDIKKYGISERYRSGMEIIAQKY